MLNHDAKEPKSDRLRFFSYSLRTLLLGSCLIAIVASLLKLTSEVRQLRTENTALRNELGHLVITDAERVHARAVNGADGPVSWRWKWLVYLPPGRKFRLCSEYDRVPGFPAVNDQYHHLHAELSGHAIISASVVKDVEGKWRMVVSTDKYEGATYIEGKAAAWLAKAIESGDYTFYVAGAKKTVDAQPGDPLVLLHIKPVTRSVSATGAIKMDAVTIESVGISLWIKESKE